MVRKQPEKQIQAAGVKLLKALGADVYVFGTRRKRGDHPGTMQTPGIPDVKAFFKVSGARSGRALIRALWWEAKAPGGRCSPAQVQFHASARLCGEIVVVGGLDDLIGYLIEAGRLRPDQVPHYRAPPDARAQCGQPARADSIHCDTHAARLREAPTPFKSCLHKGCTEAARHHSNYCHAHRPEGWAELP